MSGVRRRRLPRRTRFSGQSFNRMLPNLMTLLGVVVFAALIFADPFAAGALLCIAYITMLPFSLRSYRRLAAAAESRRAAAEVEE